MALIPSVRPTAADRELARAITALPATRGSAVLTPADAATDAAPCCDSAERGRTARAAARRVLRSRVLRPSRLPA